MARFGGIRPGSVVQAAGLAASLTLLLVATDTFAQSAPVVRGPSAPALAPATPPPSPVAAPATVSTTPRAAIPVAAPAGGAPAPAAATASAAPLTPPAPPMPACANPNALGIARTVEIDTSGGPGFGFEHFKLHDFLRPGEVVLTFDDGPWPRNTPAVLAALANHCARATFFPIGKHAIWHPEILRQVAEAGHTIGSHTWSHVDLTRKNVDAKAEIEKGLSAVRLAMGASISPSPFFRFVALRHNPELLAYTTERNLAVFSTDIDSFDFKSRSADEMIKRVMGRLKTLGKGIILMHDFQKVTGEGLPKLLDALKAGGYKLVHMRARNVATTIAQYDATISGEIKGGVSFVGTGAKPTSSVVRTVDGE